jgi:hypothetical protein
MLWLNELWNQENETAITCQGTSPRALWIACAGAGCSEKGQGRRNAPLSSLAQKLVLLPYSFRAQTPCKADEATITTSVTLGCGAFMQDIANKKASAFPRCRVNDYVASLPRRVLPI